ncbi:hypothetical protein BJ997_004175 [Cryobacterium roopkundense]|uniref:Uncharacterized protein n=1 Tax=Cryobacterium roopkundense TaxID=1001240 RepID=A0A7W9E5C7_9MICO|nr:hypothetical protein [Cryobacterium roopkundense]
MLRTVSARLELEVVAPARLIFEVTVAGGFTATESLSIRQDGTECEKRMLVYQHDTRAHQIDARPGRLKVNYRAEVTGQAAVAEVSDVDRIRYLRPSRYCESDSLRPTAIAEFTGLTGLDLLHGVSSWVGQKLAYAPGSSLPTDGAARTLLAPCSHARASAATTPTW